VVRQPCYSDLSAGISVKRAGRTAGDDMWKKEQRNGCFISVRRRSLCWFPRASHGALSMFVVCVCALFQKVALDVFGILDDIPQSH
jgi:hypothetical protein